MSRIFSNSRRASCSTRSAISGSVRATCGMGGWCMATSWARGYKRAKASGSTAGGPRAVTATGGYGRGVAKKIILDCDPGIDDALAIAFAVGSPDLDLVGITSVAGNVGLDLTTSNAQRVCEFIGATGIPVTPGAAAPLLRVRGGQ